VKATGCRSSNVGLPTARPRIENLLGAWSFSTSSATPNMINALGPGAVSRLFGFIFRAGNRNRRGPTCRAWRGLRGGGHGRVNPEAAGIRDLIDGAVLGEAAREGGPARVTAIVGGLEGRRGPRPGAGARRSCCSDAGPWGDGLDRTEAVLTCPAFLS